jgi:hypothetical protein
MYMIGPSAFLLTWSKNRSCQANAVVPARRNRFVEIDLNWLMIAPNVLGFHFEMVETPCQGVSTAEHPFRGGG